MARGRWVVVGLCVAALAASWAHVAAAAEPEPEAAIVNDDTARAQTGDFVAWADPAVCGPGGCGVAGEFPVAAWWVEHRPVLTVAKRSAQVTRAVTVATVRGSAAIATWPWRCWRGRCRCR